MLDIMLFMQTHRDCQTSSRFRPLFALLFYFLHFSYVRLKLTKAVPSHFMQLIPMLRSLALEGIDSARQWPSMSESPWPPRTKQQGAHHRLSEIKASSGQREHSQLHQQHPYHSQRQHHHHHQPRTQPSMAVGSGMSNIAMSRPSRVKETITKDSAPRKWICKQVPVKTLGGEMMMPIWFSGTFFVTHGAWYQYASGVSKIGGKERCWWLWGKTQREGRMALMKER